LIHLVSLNPALDISFDLKDPSKGKIGQVLNTQLEPGGKALNVARFLKKARVPFRLWLGTGGGVHPTHLLYRTLLSQERIKAEFLSDRTPIRFNTVLKQGKRSKKFNHLGFETVFSGFDKLFRSVKKGDILVLAGRLPQGDDQALYASWIDIFQRKGVRVAVDTSGTALAFAFKAKPWFFKVNRHELAEGLSVKVKNLKDVVGLVKKNWLKRGFERGAVTDGAAGAVLWRYPECYWIRTPRSKKDFVVGAGDGFLAGYLYAFRSNKPLKAAGLMAGAFGSEVADQGIQGFTLSGMKRKQRSITVRRVL
jgi:1-phosphofructokinase